MSVSVAPGGALQLPAHLQFENLLRIADALSSDMADLRRDMVDYTRAGRRKQVSLTPSAPNSPDASVAASTSGSAVTAAAALPARLMARQKAADERLASLRAAKVQEELSHVRPAPAINAKSRALASRRGGGKDIAARSAAAVAAKESRTARMREALAAREAAQLKAAPSINPTSRRLARGGRSVDRMLEWEASKQAKLAAKRQAAAAAEAATVQPSVTASKQSKRILSMRRGGGGGSSGGDASSRLYRMGVRKVAARREEEDAAPRAPRSRSTGRAPARGASSLYDRGRAASAAREARLSAARDAQWAAAGVTGAARRRAPRATSAPRRAASPAARQRGRQAPASPPDDSDVRARLFRNRAASAPRERRAGGERRPAPTSARIPRRRAPASPTPAAAAGEEEVQLHTAVAPPAAPRHGVALPGGWFQYVDKASGAAYFFHQASGEVTWTRPTGSPPAVHPPSPPPGHSTAPGILSPTPADSAWVAAAGGGFASRFAQVAASLAD